MYTFDLMKCSYVSKYPPACSSKARSRVRAGLVVELKTLAFYNISTVTTGDENDPKFKSLHV